jgi:hypothetical protein
MIKPILLHTVFFFFVLFANAQKLTGSIKDAKGNKIAFATILVKGSTAGTSANKEANYLLNLKPGNYTIVCQSVGFTKMEKTITMGNDNQVLDFELTEQQYTLKDVVVKKGEDPAYEIIRNAIRQREKHLKEVEEFQCEVYLKGKFGLVDPPKKFLGDTLDFEDGDTSNKKILFLSEAIANYSVGADGEKKIVVSSTKVSGSSDGFGFANPQIFSFYENSIGLGNLNPRGFVSPIANGALNFYRYKYEGSFTEDNRLINRIRVTPKRKYEPLFNGYINIVENEWRLHSIDLEIYKENQMQFLDTLKLQQVYVPADGIRWVPKNQSMYISGKFLLFKFNGNFLQVYNKYNLNPNFGKKYFDEILLKYEDSSNKKTLVHWDSIRPIPLLDDEVVDYRKKDSLEQKRKDPAYLDSIDRRNNKFKPIQFLLFGQSFNNRKKRESFSVDPILNAASFNTVEGWNLTMKGTYSKRYSESGREELTIVPSIRYGFSNGHLNAHVTGTYSFEGKLFSNLRVQAGRRVLQFNNENPISPGNNLAYTFWDGNNYMKLYEAWVAKATYRRGLGKGLTLSLQVNFQDRQSLRNTDLRYWKDGNPSFTSNFPLEISNVEMPDNKSLTTTVGLSWQPGARYVELPNRIFNIGSKYPTFSASITNGLPNILSSNANFMRWNFGVRDDLNMRLLGTLKYRLQCGGFLNKDYVAIPDWQHFNGNQTIFASDYLNSFQLAPYYRYSNTEAFYAKGHVEWHLNGLLTNKIPFFRKLNWFLVGGANTFYVNKNNYYVESFIGLENILKVFRLDFVIGNSPAQNTVTGFRLGLPLGAVQNTSNDD